MWWADLGLWAPASEKVFDFMQGGSDIFFPWGGSLRVTFKDLPMDEPSPFWFKSASKLKLVANNGSCVTPRVVVQQQPCKC